MEELVPESARDTGSERSSGLHDTAVSRQLSPCLTLGPNPISVARHFLTPAAVSSSTRLGDGAPTGPSLKEE